MNTGILIQPFSTGEPMLLVFDVSDLGGTPYLSASNVDLGPREWLPEFLMVMPYVLIVLGILAVFIFALRRQKQSRKGRKRVGSGSKRVQVHQKILQNREGESGEKG